MFMSEPTSYRDNARPQGMLENLQDMVIRRFSRTPKPLEPVVYEFTDDKALLHQYYIMRERMLGTDKYLPRGVLPQDIHDKVSHILIARRDKLCIGGARLTIREGDETFPLPMESDEFKLRDIFPHLPLDTEKHAVISKFAILDDQKNAEILYALCKIMYRRMLKNDVRFLFIRATNIALARNWRLISNTLRPQSTRICSEIDVPDSPMYPGEKQHLVFTDLTGPAQIPTKVDLQLVEKSSQPQPLIALVD
jgi:hypothetical protein